MQGEDNDSYESYPIAQKHAKVDPRLKSAKKNMLTKVSSQFGKRLIIIGEKQKKKMI